MYAKILNVCFSADFKTPSSQLQCSSSQSKATTNNITLNLMDVDVVNLMKQVSVEHADKFEQMGLQLRWNVPEEKIILKLDNQKTYRIFENLFVNIQKYAMPNSRVYIDVEKPEGNVTITMRNMSAVELNVRGDELTERFVRGDASRNTEGSGLGLAIARSLLQKLHYNHRKMSPAPPAHVQYAAGKMQHQIRD